MTEPKASVIVLAWNGIDYLESCLNSVLGQAYANFEVIVVDNSSSDGSADFIAQHYPEVKLIRNERNLGFSAGNNVGLRQATGQVRALLNQDTVVQPGWLAALVKALESYPDAGIVGSKILDLDGITLQHAGAHFDWPIVEGLHYGRGERDAGQYDEPREVEFVTGAALAVRSDVLEQIGLLDEGFFPGYFEDVDLCVRARRAGYRVLYVPSAIVLHHGSMSFSQAPDGIGPLVYRNRLRFILKSFTADQIVNEFVPAEIARLPYLFDEQLQALALACTQAQVMWPSLSQTLVNPPTRESVLDVIAALRKLHEAIAQQQANPSWQEQNRTTVSDEAARPDIPSPAARRHELLQELAQGWHIEERPFRSSVPVIGPLIAGFRSAWIRVATRWYVLQLLEQQQAYNCLVSHLLRQHMRQIGDRELSIAALAEQTARLEMHVLELEDLLRRLRVRAE